MGEQVKQTECAHCGATLEGHAECWACGRAVDERKSSELAGAADADDHDEGHDDGGDEHHADDARHSDD